MQSDVNSAANNLRVGGIDYLNAQPLIYNLDSGSKPAFEVSHHLPSELSSRLEGGDLDIALVPVVAYLDRDDYYVIPGACIASYGPVWSIRLYHRVPIDQVRTVALDTSSRTSTFLTRLLFRELWSNDCRFESVPPRELVDEILNPPESDLKVSLAASKFDAVLLIGDSALSCGQYEGWSELDLGVEWTRWTGLPFVYAFWLWRNPSSDEEERRAIVERFQRAKASGAARIDEIVARSSLPESMDECACRDYLSSVISYELNDEAMEGLELFFTKLRDAGILETPSLPLRTLTAPPVSAQASPVASAQASPVASAQASPVASAQASPVASAQASPVASTQALQGTSVQPLSRSRGSNGATLRD